MKFSVLTLFSMALTLGHGVLPALSIPVVDNISLSSVIAQQTSDQKSKPASKTDLDHEGHDHNSSSKPSPKPSPSPSSDSKGDSHDHQSHQDHNNKDH